MKYIGIAIVCLVVITSGWFFFVRTPEHRTPPVDVSHGPQPGTFREPTTPPPGGAPSQGGGVTTDGHEGAQITRARLAAHATASDCWVGFEGAVYDVTAFIPKHPGGSESVAAFCGKAEEFENAFIQQHGRSKVRLMMQVAPLQGALAK